MSYIFFVNVEFPLYLHEYVLQVVKEIPPMPKAIGDFEREPHGIVDSGFQNKDVEDVGSSPQISVENDDSTESRESTEEGTKADTMGNNFTNITTIEVEKDDGQSYSNDSVTEVREEIGESLSSAFWIDPATEVKEEVRQSPPRDTVTEEKEVSVQSLPSAFWIDTTAEVKEEVGQSQLRDTVPDVNVGSSEPEGPSDQPDLPIDTNGQVLPSTRLEDLEPDAFRKEMQETAKEEDLKEFSDKILYNQTRSDTDKQAESHNLVAETMEAVTDLTQVFFLVLSS